MNTLSPQSRLMDWINITLTLVAWILPDLPIVAKGLISIVLIGSLIVARVHPNFVINVGRPWAYVLMIGVPIVSSILVWCLVPVLYSVLFNRTQDAGLVIALGIVLGFSCGVLNGLPLTLYAARLGQRSRYIALSFLPSTQVGTGGCVLQIILLIGFWVVENLLAIAVVASTNASLLLISIMGPGSAFVYYAGYPADLIQLITAPFWVWLSNCFFSAIGYLIGRNA